MGWAVLHFGHVLQQGIDVHAAEVEGIEAHGVEWDAATDCAPGFYLVTINWRHAWSHGSHALTNTTRACIHPHIRAYFRQGPMTTASVASAVAVGVGNTEEPVWRQLGGSHFLSGPAAILNLASVVFGNALVHV